MKHLTFFSLLMLFFSFRAQTTQVISLCSGESGGEDAYLASGAPNSNYGNHPSMGGNTWTCYGSLCLSRALFRFDLSSVPTGAVLTNASLQLFGDLGWSNYPTTGGPNNSGILERVTAPWIENAVTWNSQPGTTTQNSLAVPGSTSAAQNYTLNVTSLVQDMLNAGNYGFMLKMQDEQNYYLSLMFASSDNANKAACPVLAVTYLLPTALKTLSDDIKLNVYPNPAGEVLHLSCSAEMGKVEVRDVAGRTCITETFYSADHSLSLDLEPGVYFVSIYDIKANLVGTHKIIRQ